MLVKRLSAIIGKNIEGSLGWDGTRDAHWEFGRKLGGGGDFKIGCWNWDYENRHWADTDSHFSPPPSLEASRVGGWYKRKLTTAGNARSGIE